MEPGMEPIGRIVRLQAQVRSLKQPGPRFRCYDPAGISEVLALELDEGGVAGIAPHGDRVPDVHHRDHPESKYRGNNGVSIGFTSHYDLMRGRFPKGLDDGMAGENILVATDRRWSAADLAGGMAIATGDGRIVSLSPVIVADPCVEFSRWLLDWPEDERPGREVSDAVIFLGGGMRGFYASYDGPPARVSIGDWLYAARS